MSTSDIIAQLPHLSAEDLAVVQAKFDELAGDAWQDRAGLSDDDKRILNKSLDAYDKSPDAGGSWDDVKARIEAKLRS